MSTVQLKMISLDDACQYSFMSLVGTCKAITFEQTTCGDRKVNENAI